jgi:NodT family efflux transporter outer membrane factor (OMF) lipoprotein
MNRISSIRRFAVPCMSLWIAAGCATVERTATPQPALEVSALGAQATAVAWPADDWWKRYADPQLDALVADALAASPTLAAAQARIARAEAASGVARAALLPQVGANGIATYQKYSNNSIVPPPLGGSSRTDARATIDFSFEFDFWDKNGAALRAALSETQASAADREAARLALTTSVAQAYFNLQRLFVQRDVSNAAIGQREDIVRITSERFAAGLDTKVEVHQAEAALATVRTELAQYDDAIATVRNQLAALAGAGPARGERIAAAQAVAHPTAVVPASIPLDLLARRPEIAASRWRVEASHESTAVARAQFYPNINLAAFAGLSSLGLSNLLLASSSIVGVGPAVHLPIFEGGRLNANLRGREAETDLAVATYNQTVIDAVRDLADAMTSIRNLARITDEQAQARTATNQAYEVAVIRYRAGLGNYLSVLTAQSAQLAQDRLAADLASRAFELDINLTRALGGGYVDRTQAASMSAAPR